MVVADRRIDSSEMLPMNARCLTQNVARRAPPAGTESRIEADQHGNTEGIGHGGGHPIQGSIEEGEGKDSRRVRGGDRLPSEARYPPFAF